MDLTGLIESAEKKYKQILEEFFTSVYPEITLSSHGIDHHRRVWKYARELLISIPLENTPVNLRLPENLIIACYLHDIGMSVDPGMKHGTHSRKICSRFLMDHNLSEYDLTDVLEAIEYHNNKDYNSNSAMNTLLTILSVADDLDAFGCIGIFRYSEIYLTRNIEYDKIGYMIRDNAKKRYDNFIKIFGSLDELVVRHWERYYLLDMFFNKYNDQLPFYEFNTTNPSGFCGVVEIIKKIMQNHLNLKEFCADHEKHSRDPLILWYLAELKKELCH